ncbi:MAG: phosphoglucosamine mutase [Kiritimatiellae bacterium]|nr:phosphoglucosamine mutase [Kiritimatiellia bacterium]MDW8458669.1 phosphoglucosamine mutase [Verrucomicrobiota bacterium]
MRELLKVGISGVRGIVGESFTPQIAVGFAQAFGAFVGRGSVLIGRDTRPSGLMIEYAVVAGLQSVGCKPVLVGVVPTPTLLFLTRHLAARGGIMITASHNPAEWNALKFIDRRGLFLGEEKAQHLFDLYHQQDFPFVAEADIARVAHQPYPMEAHFGRIVDYVDRDSIRARRFRVAVDVVNGVGALYSKFFLENLLGCAVVPLHDAPTGVFERNPEPLPQHLTALSQAVVREGCDIGFAQDPDGDRLAIVDERGEPIGEDLTLAFACKQVLEAHERGPVVINLSASRVVEDVARAAGCSVSRTRIGETHVARAMLESNAVIGGEHNGGVILPRIHPCRDSFAAMAIVLELMARTGKTVSQLRSEMPAYVVVRRKNTIRSEQVPVALRELRRAYSHRPMNFLDGCFIEFEDAWAHVRRSNTEPVLRITVEAPRAEQANALADEIESRLSPFLG